MKWIAVIMTVLYLVLFLLSKKEDVDSEISSCLRPFYRMSLFLYKQLCVRGVLRISRVRVKEDLAALYPEKGREAAFTDYCVGKMARSLLICLAGTLFGVIVNVQAGNAGVLAQNGTVARGNYGEAAKEIQLECTAKSGKKEFQIPVSARAWGEEELEEKYHTFLQQLPERILGSNPSAEEVSSDLLLQESYEGFPFGVCWTSSQPDWIRSDGVVTSDGESTGEVELTAEVSCGEWQREHTICVRVVPPFLPAQEKEYREMEKFLIRSEESDRTEENWQLPQTWKGERLVWTEKIKDNSTLLWIGFVLTAAIVYVMTDYDLHTKREKRKQLMKKEYPNVVHRLTLYLGAGMTVRNAFGRIVEEYEKDKQDKGVKSLIYEEMLYTCRELRAGVSEGAAYEHFGRRTGLQEYIRLSTLLSQNVKRGNSTLLSRLREETEKAAAEQLQYGKQLGQEAVTKLLLPMVLMLLAVMLMIMVPAFSSMGV